MPDVQVGDLSHKEAIRFFQEKLLIPSRQWTDLLGPVHAKSFTVAGASTLSIVEDFYNSIRALIETGGTLNDFRKDFDNIVDKHGWSYKGKRGWRTKVIFYNNKNAAFMAGKWEQMWRMKALRPYLTYMTVGDERVRYSHAKWHKVTLPIDHPIWKIIFPPNDFGCRCNVISRSKDDLEEDGIEVSKIDMPEKVQVTNPNTGEITEEYPGIGLGWDYNVGREWLAPEVTFGQQLMDVPADLRKVALDNLDSTHLAQPFKQLVNKVAYQLAKNERVTAGHAQTAGYLSNDIVNALLQRKRIPVGLAVVARDADIAHFLRTTKTDRGASVPISIASTLPSVIKTPDVVLWDTADPALIYAKRLESGDYAKFVVKLDFKAKLNERDVRFREHLNVVKTAGIVSWADLNAGRYEVIQGKLVP